MLPGFCCVHGDLHIQAGEVVYTAGQIGLAPGTMQLVGEKEQPSLALTHAQVVLRACHTHLDSALCGLCYYTSEEAGRVAKATWNQVSQ